MSPPAQVPLWGLGPAGANPVDLCPFEILELVRDCLRTAGARAAGVRLAGGDEEARSPFVESVLAQLPEGYTLLAAMLQSARVRLDETLRRLRCQPSDFVTDHSKVHDDEF